MTPKQRLEELEREAAQLRLKIASQSPAATEPSPEMDQPQQASAASPTPATPEQIAKAEGFIRQARLARQRGQAAQAGLYLKQAEEAAPKAPVVLEYIGDDYVERKMYSEARETYKRAKELDPKNTAIERKFAEMVLRTGPGMSAAMLSDYEVMASGKIAVFLSALLPGLGQVVIGEVYKGIFTFAAWAGMLLWISLIPDGMAGLFASIGVTLHKGQHAEFHAIVLVPIFIAFVIWISSVFDVKMGSGMMTPRKVDRPAPLDNLPFE